MIIGKTPPIKGDVLDRAHHFLPGMMATDQGFYFFGRVAKNGK